MACASESHCQFKFVLFNWFDMLKRRQGMGKLGKEMDYGGCRQASRNRLALS